MTWRITIAILVFLGLVGAAVAQFAPPMVPYMTPGGPMLKGGLTGPMVPNVASSGGGGSGGLLLENGASNLLLEDGVSNLCLESGC